MTLYVTEFANISKDHEGRVVEAAVVPSLATQVLTVTGTSAAVTNPFNAKTKFVRLHTDAACSVKFAAAPTATASDMRLPENAVEYFTVDEILVASGLKVAAIAN